MLKKSLMFLVTVLVLSTGSAQKILPLYPDKIPNSRDVPDTEKVDVRGPDNRVFRATAVPTLQVFRPLNQNGRAVIICPGGGYTLTAYDKEGTLVARELNKDSVTAFVLKYRIPSPVTNVDPSLAPLQDAQQAIRYVRENAGEYGVDPAKVGIIGFSAGGHLAATAATQFHRPADPNERSTTSVRPDFAALIYPVIGFTPELMHAGSRRNLLGDEPTAAEDLRFSAQSSVDSTSPPAFLVHAADDRSVPVGNSIAYYQACLYHEVPVEMHLYAAGGHGFGMNNTTTQDRWIERLVNWLRTL